MIGYTWEKNRLRSWLATGLGPRFWTSKTNWALHPQSYVLLNLTWSTWTLNGIRNIWIHQDIVSHNSTMLLQFRTKTSNWMTKHTTLVQQVCNSVCWRMLTYADVCWCMQTYADVCWRMLTYADVYWRLRDRGWTDKIGETASAMGTVSSQPFDLKEPSTGAPLSASSPIHVCVCVCCCCVCAVFLCVWVSMCVCLAFVCCV
jgi:hypothetical protein